ncbi:DUF4148 domain-containing protein [Paucibacter sp. M5-1]|uniref:DUF4148 domain-containing protein n=1 Tax=Paucibacter sp. M5-1 TaxID=3015998 RepID=UPI003F7EFFDD
MASQNDAAPARPNRGRWLKRNHKEFIMSRISTPIAIAATAILAAISIPAMASSGFTPANTESGGAYHAMPGGKTRAEVRAELQKAREDGSLAKINSEAGYAPEAEAAARRPANVATLPPVKLGAGQIQFEAPAAGGGRTRAEVLEELRRAREDGSLRRMNTNRGY